MKSKLMSRLALRRALTMVVSGTFIPINASAITANTQHMATWSGSSCPQANTLNHTYDQIRYFRAEMRDSGHSTGFWYANENVWASDLIEDKDFGGEDNIFADSSEMYALSSHGNGNSNAWGQTFSSPTYNAGTSSSCSYDAELSRFGEKGTYYATPNPGRLRYMLLLTCFSVDVNPDQQWNQSFWYGLDVIMGYRGESADSSYTDEVGEDLASAAFGDTDPFKESWFWAMEDWWIDDTGSIIASGSTGADAVSRRDNIQWSWAERTGTPFYSLAWSWHSG